MLPNKNIIKVLNDIQLFGAPCYLTVVSSWDNTLEIQVPPELHFDMYHGTKKTSTVLPIAPDTEEDSGKEEEAHAQPANTRGGKTGESSMESLALRRGKRKCLEAQYDTEEIVGLSVQQPQQDNRKSQRKPAKVKTPVKGLSVQQPRQDNRKSQKKHAKAKTPVKDPSVHQPPHNRANTSPWAEKVFPPLSEHPGTSAEKAQEYEDPSLQTALQEAQQRIYGQNQEIATLREWVTILTEDRNFLRERLKEALALRKERGGELATKIPPGDQPPGQRKEDSGESDLSSSSDSSESESSSESSEDKKPKKKSKSKRKLKRKSDKKKRKHLRVKTPDHSIRRYNMVLEMVKKEGISKAVAYTRLGVDRNTIVYQAPIAEIAFVNPELYKTLRSSFKRKDSIKRFAETCRGFCEQEPTASAILQHKDNGSLLDIHRIHA